MTTEDAKVAVIGDVVGSRRHPDRTALQERLDAALEAGKRADAVQPFTPTVGDEFQGLFPGTDAALRASLDIRLRLAGTVEVRMGIGVGEVATLTPGTAPYGQDGPAWWRAREALGLAEERSRGYGWPTTLRTVFVSEGPGERAVNAHLMLRDHILSSVDEIDGRILVGLLEGATQTALAAELGLDKSSVSRRVAQHGLASLLRSLDGFDEVLG